jgi:hypothetical protein
MVLNTTFNNISVILWPVCLENMTIVSYQIILPITKIAEKF